MTTATTKKIQIYLATGEPRGIRIAEITTRIVKAVLILRSDSLHGKLRRELDLPGIYSLFGDHEEGAKPIVYIGQTEDARQRLHSHNKTKTFGKTASLSGRKSFWKGSHTALDLLRQASTGRGAWKARLGIELGSRRIGVGG